MAEQARKVSGTVGTALEADISFTDGPGAVAATFKLRGQALTLLLPRAEDGGAAGLYRIALDKRDGLIAALSSLPATVSGPLVQPDQPAASFLVRDKGKQRRLVFARPAADPRADEILADLARCEKAAMAKPAATVALDIQTPLPHAKPGKPQSVVVRATVKGEHGAEVRIDPGLLLLQAMPKPKPTTPGVTPLPPEWDPVSAPLAKSSPQAVKAGARFEMTLTVNDFSPELRWMRAVYDGNATFRASDFADEVRLSLASKVVPLPAASKGSKK